MTGKLISKRINLSGREFMEEVDDFKKQFPRRSLRLSQKNFQPKKKDENGGEPNVSYNLSKQSVVNKGADAVENLKQQQHNEIIRATEKIIPLAGPSKISVRQDLIDKSLSAADCVSHEPIKIYEKKRTLPVDNGDNSSQIDKVKKCRRSARRPARNGQRKNKKTAAPQRILRAVQRKYSRSKVNAVGLAGKRNNRKPFSYNYMEKLKNLKLDCCPQASLPLCGTSMLPDIYPPHFKYQLPPENVPYQLGSYYPRENLYERPTVTMTPEETETLPSSSTSPSMPGSLRGLFDTDDIHELLNVEPVVYRLNNYHVQAFAAILNLSVVYVKEILDRVVRLDFLVLKKMDEALNRPCTGEEDIFAENFSSPEYIPNSQTPPNSRIFPSQKK
ncbi:uncharacterized protein LOC119632220 [Glossina fuscipes]|uniref:Uncharacterized protein LOC119632220 n=1 Tax=Glossina fuscipes TaxID=7396 RepID=A0A8U0W799_9MUSC|nr:uncharacterized protein LOC119632220 [Glossina fuscipes]